MRVSGRRGNGGGLFTRAAPLRTASPAVGAPPRRSGKHELAFFRQHCVIKTPKAELVVPYAAVKHLAVRGAPQRHRLGGRVR